MRYITKIHRVEAVKYDGLNKSEIEALISNQVENFVYKLGTGTLLLRDGNVRVGDWVIIEEGLVKIFSDAQFKYLYEKWVDERPTE